jgi:WD40 repeat protein
MEEVIQFDPGHDDRVSALHANYDGSRILTASIDHRIKVWARDEQSGQRSLIETFTAHDADIRDVCRIPRSSSPLTLAGKVCQYKCGQLHRHGCS